MLYYYSDGQFRQSLKELLLHVSREVVLCCSMGKRVQQDLLDFDYIDHDMYVPSTLDTLYTTAPHRTQPLQSSMAHVNQQLFDHWHFCGLWTGRLGDYT